MSNALSDDAESLYNQFNDHLDISVAEIESQLRTLRSEFAVPAEEARRTVERRLREEADIDRSDSTQGLPECVDAASINSDGTWLSLKGEVVQLWDASSESVAQTGLITDDTGTIKFTLWAKSADDLPTLEEGEAYRFDNVVTDEYQGQYSVNLNSSSTVVAIDESFEADQTETVDGAVVAIKDGSGLIERCPQEDCTRTLRSGRCSEHGAVDGELDLRIKAILDDGQTVHRLIFDAEATKEMTGMSLADAKALATEALDRSVVVKRLREMLVGRYLAVDAEQVGQYHLVREVKDEPPAVDPESILITGRSIAVTDEAVDEVLTSS